MEIAHRAKRVTSSSEAMDMDEANRHTQNILSRVNQQQEPDKLTSRTGIIWIGPELGRSIGGCG